VCVCVYMCIVQHTRESLLSVADAVMRCLGGALTETRRKTKRWVMK
jgi:hypothetical protein